MRSVLKLPMTILSVLLLSNCTTLMRATSDGNADPISGHQVGIGSPEVIKDFGDIRVRMSPIKSVRNRPISPTYAFLFSWTPDAYNQRNLELGRREPTQQDWQNLASKAKMKPKILKYMQKLAARSAFKPYVDPQGFIKRCNDTYGGKYGCSIGLKMSKSLQKQLAQKVLSAHKNTCKIARIDPAEVLALSPGTVKSGELSLVASISC